MSQAGKKEPGPEVRLVVEVNGNPVGFLNLDIERLWPLINHRKRDRATVEWMDPKKLDSIIRAGVIKRLIARMQEHLYQTLGNEIVKAELDVESFSLKADAAAQAFGKTTADIEKLVLESDRTPLDFYSFFWDHLLDDQDETIDLKKEWKTGSTPPR